MKNNLRTHTTPTSIEDIEVEGQTCCQSILRSRSAKNNTIKVSSPFNKLKTSTRDKGIKITHCSSLNNIHSKKSKPSLKLKISISLKDSLPLIKKIKTCETAQSSHQVRPTKLKVNKKCLDFKNKIILEHNLGPQQILSSDLEGLQLTLSPQKTEGNLSTQYNTPRQTKQLSYNLFQSVSPSVVFSTIEERTIQNEQGSQPEEKNQADINLSIKKSRKTLQNLYQLRSGKKMQVLQSEMSQVSQEDLVSIVESFVWN